MFPTIRDTAYELLAISGLQGYQHRIKENRNAPYPAYDVFIKLPQQQRGKKIFTIIVRSAT